MGTKNKPGKFDCYANARPNEPMFVLLGRDPLAGMLVGLWAETRRRLETADSDQTVEALELTHDLAEYAEQVKGPTEVARQWAALMQVMRAKGCE